jgi:hypothetical protein
VENLDSHGCGKVRRVSAHTGDTGTGMVKARTRGRIIEESENSGRFRSHATGRKLLRNRLPGQVARLLADNLLYIGKYAGSCDLLAGTRPLNDQGLIVIASGLDVNQVVRAG